MQPQTQSNARRLSGRIVLQIVIASVLAIVLALLSVFAFHLHSSVAELQTSVKSVYAMMDLIQESMEYTHPVFTIAGHELSYNKDSNGESYSGEAIISCDQQDAFIVILKTTLVSGGSTYTDSISYNMLIIQDGFGKYSTYDWGEPGKLEKPRYEFEIVSYFRSEINDE